MHVGTLLVDYATGEEHLLFVLQLRLGCGQISGHALHQPHLLERDDIVAARGANSSSIHGQTGFGQALPNDLLSGT